MNKQPIPWGMDLPITVIRSMHPDDPIATWEGEIVRVEVFLQMLQERYRRITKYPKHT